MLQVLKAAIFESAPGCSDDGFWWTGNRCIPESGVLPLGVVPDGVAMIVPFTRRQFAK
jgi:hypothetical protein